MKCATIQNVNVKSKLLLVLNNLNLKAMGLKIQLKKIFKGFQTAWIKFLKPALNMASPYIGKAVSA